ncbi:MAG: ribosome biogenesis GTP-binding protein YihA/YsxC [Deltaproteobacteria bacterium]|nr:ribosome biogenesis GTP-binding protein YihA/YsxC [Deltaproteobacteria bacterium]
MDVQFLKSAYKESHYPLPDLPEIAFAGRSNVGKSSLINAVVNRKKLARTSAKPGRTQAINFFRLGNEMMLVDLPGYGFARVPDKVRNAWRKMVETYLRTRETLRGVVVILDIRRDPTTGDLDLLHWLDHYAITPIVVLTKADKVSRQETRKRHSIITRALKEENLIRAGGVISHEPVIFSARTRQGRDEVLSHMKTVAAFNPTDPREPHNP